MAASPADCMAAFEAALGRKDLDTAMSLLTHDVAFFYSNGSAHWGRQAIRAAIQANFDTIDRDNYTTREHIWLAESDSTAAIIYSFSWSGLVNGKKAGGRGRGTTVFRREPDGWRIAHEHLSQGRWKPA
jgi:ketosteroid isomerase-like protein